MSDPRELQIPGLLKNAITDAMRIQLSTEAKVEASVVSPDSAAKAAKGIDVVSLMGIKSGTHTGSLGLAFPKATFLKFLEAMIGETHTEITSQNADACSELLNIIYASARVKINELGFDFQPAIPGTVCGKELWFPGSQFNHFVRFDCSTDKGAFLLAFALKRSK